MTQKVNWKYDYIPIGPKPTSKAEAWWALSRQAKDLLAQERESGRFGGTPGLAPYWKSQDIGEVKAYITGKFYIEKAKERWRPMVHPAVMRFLRG